MVAVCKRLLSSLSKENFVSRVNFSVHHQALNFHNNNRWVSDYLENISKYFPSIGKSSKLSEFLDSGQGIPFFFFKVPNGYLYVIHLRMYYLSVFWGFPRPILGEAPHGRVTAFFCKPALKIGTDEKTIVQLFCP